jgi:hypothetical protein
MRLKLFAVCFGFLAPNLGFGADYLPPSPPPPPLIGQFSGFYAAGGAGYGVSVQRSFSINASPCCGSGNNSGAFGQVAPQGWGGTVVSGYNIQYGAFLGGIELAGRWGREGADGIPARQSFFSTGNNVASVDYSYQFRSDAGVNLAARAGLVFDRTLVFTKLGIGVAHAEDRFSFQGSGPLCVTTNFINGQNVCTATLPIGSAAFTIGRWSPSIVAGVGMEHNIGRFFLRAGAELEGITGLKGSSSLSVPLSPNGFASGFVSSEAFWTTRGTALVGFRF